MDLHGQFRERRHIVQEGRRRTPVALVACVHGSRGAAHRGADQSAVGEARVGHGAGIGQGGDENGRAGRAVSVHERRDGTAPNQGLLRRAVLEDGPQQGRLRDRRDVRGTPGRKVAEGRGPWHRAGFQVPDRTLRLGQVQGAASVQGRHQVRIIPHCLFHII